MAYFPQEPHERHDDELFEIADPCPENIPGLPYSWQHYGWWIASLFFAGIWILDSLSTLNEASGFTGLSRLAGSLWNLVLAMLLSYLIFKFSRPYLRSLSYVLCALSAGYLLLAHR
ncbi:hypothetical protein AB4072_08035 [Microvirga sp. 2MCAF38]|uniref:hypothetical protein n=1 Tax=Microvirga sp. 2MCAF38 TaxID=3232989 RepID=UPI003F961226